MLAKIISLPIHSDHRGKLAVAESENNIPFQIKRVFFVYEIPQFTHRAGHAHYTLEQVLIINSGHAEIDIIDTKKTTKKFHLSSPDKALLIPKLHWTKIKTLTDKSTITVLCSEKYEQKDYIHCIEKFYQLKK